MRSFPTIEEAGSSLPEGRPLPCKCNRFGLQVSKFVLLSDEFMFGCPKSSLIEGRFSSFSLGHVSVRSGLLSLSSASA